MPPLHLVCHKRLNQWMEKNAWANKLCSLTRLCSLCRAFITDCNKAWPKRKHSPPCFIFFLIFFAVDAVDKICGNRLHVHRWCLYFKRYRRWRTCAQIKVIETLKYLYNQKTTEEENSVKFPAKLFSRGKNPRCSKCTGHVKKKVGMGWLQKGIAVFFEYDTPRIVHIRSKKVGVINRLIQLVIIGYIIGYGHYGYSLI